MKSRIDKIKARLAAATPGPWLPRDNNVVLTPTGLAIGSFSTGFEQSKSDAAFIAAAPTDIAYLLSRLERAEALLREHSCVNPHFAKQVAAYFAQENADHE